MNIGQEQLIKKLKEQSKQYGLECGYIEYASGKALVEISTGPLVDHIPGLLRLEIHHDIRILELSVNWFSAENGEIIDKPSFHKQTFLREHGWRKYDEHNFKSRKGDFEFDLDWFEEWISVVKEQQRRLDEAGANE